MKKKQRILYFLPWWFACLFFACEDTVMQDDTRLMEADNRVDTAHPLQIQASIDNGFAGTKGYGTTSYRDAVYFDTADQIAVFATRTRKDGQPGTNNDVFASFYDLGYKAPSVSTPTNGWTLARSGVGVYIPFFPSTRLDMFAYYPWPDIAQMNEGKNTIINTNDIRKIHFRIYQDQTTTTLNLCNIMRARPVLNQSYTSASRTVTFVFEHLMSLLEFYIYKDGAITYHEGTTDPDPDKTWMEGDSLILRRVVVLGKRISTEGYFDLTGPDPNVRITEISSMYNEAIYKKDSNGTLLHTLEVGKQIDAYTQATPGARRHVIIPPVDMIPEDLPDPQDGEQSEMEIMVELQWKPAGGTHFEYTNRRGIVRGYRFQSGKKYIIDIPIRKKAVDNHGELIIKESQEGWTNKTWSASFK